MYGLSLSLCPLGFLVCVIGTSAEKFVKIILFQIHARKHELDFLSLFNGLEETVDAVSMLRCNSSVAFPQSKGAFSTYGNSFYL